ncbi:TPA: recombinase family protein [Photobacterium damselae]
MALIPYARVSTGKQIDGLSLSLQNDNVLLEQLALQYGTTVSHLFYQDAGVSSYKGKNASVGELSRLLADIEIGLISSGDIIVMRALDRLSRQNLTASEVLYNRIISAGVMIHTTIDNHLYKMDDPMSSILATLALKTANEESAKKSHLTNRYASHRIQQAKDGQKLDGHSFDVGIGRHPFWITIDKPTKTVRQHPINWDHAKHMITLALDGYGVSTVMRYAHSVGLELSYSACAKMFNTRAVYGVLEITHQREDHVLTDYYPALCSESEYYQIRAIKDAQTKVSNNQRKQVSILSGIQKLYCGCCGSVLCIARNVTQKTEYYRCANRLVKCYPYIKQEYLDRIVLTAIGEKVLSSQLMDNGHDKTLQGIELELETKVMEYQKQQTFLFDNLDLFDDTMKSLLSAKKQSITELESKIEQLKLENAKNNAIHNIDLSQYQYALDLYHQHIDCLERYIQGDNELKSEIRHIVSTLVDRITVDSRYMIRIQFKDGSTSYYMLLRRRDGKKVHQRNYARIQIVSDCDYNGLISVYPELDSVTSTESLIDSHTTFLEDVLNPIPLGNVYVKPDTKVEAFFNLLVDDVYEWKRKSIMAAGATCTQWQEYKDSDVSVYGWTKVEVELTTKYYTKRHAVLVHKSKSLDLNSACVILGVSKVKIK